MGNEEREAMDPGQAAAEKAERAADDAFLTGAVGMATTPRLTGRALRGGGADDGESYLFEDDSWRSGVEEEGEPGQAPPPKKGLFRRLFGG